MLGSSVGEQVPWPRSWLPYEEAPVSRFPPCSASSGLQGALACASWRGPSSSLLENMWVETVSVSGFPRTLTTSVSVLLGHPWAPAEVSPGD